jgi:hypothetical protein
MAWEPAEPTEANKPLEPAEAWEPDEPAEASKPLEPAEAWEPDEPAEASPVASAAAPGPDVTNKKTLRCFQLRCLNSVMLP